MFIVALKMLVGDRAKYFGILMGLTFASLLITQQAAIFDGLMSRTYGFLTDTGQPDLWVMDPNVRFVDDYKPLLDNALYRVRSVPGVDWAVPMYRGLLRARLPDGDLQLITVVGLDDATLIGGPPNMVDGSLADLKKGDGVIIDLRESKDKLTKPGPDGKPVPLGVGDTMEIGDQRAVIVGTSYNSPTFQSQPIIYTTYSRATRFGGNERKRLGYVLVGARPGVDLKQLAAEIHEGTGLTALTRQEFADASYDYFWKFTGIPVNFGTAVILGFIVGVAIAGQMFYNFTIDNTRYFGTLKAMGASNRLIAQMVALQALFVGFIGYGIGVGLASLLGLLLSQSELSFRIQGPLLWFTALAILLICVISAMISLRRLFKLEPAAVFRGLQ